MNKPDLISLRYSYSPKKMKNICMHLLKEKPTIKELKLRIEKIFSKEKKECVPNYVHKKGENHVSKKYRTTTHPGGFFPSSKENRAWLRTITKYLYDHPLNSERQIRRYYFHVDTFTSGTKYLKVSRKSIRAAKRKHVITVYLELL